MITTASAFSTEALPHTYMMDISIAANLTPVVHVSELTDLSVKYIYHTTQRSNNSNDPLYFAHSQGREHCFFAKLISENSNKDFSRSRGLA